MGATVGRETDALAFVAALAEAPYRYDFYQTLRRLECLYDGKPRWGRALRPIDEPVRLGQEPDLSFAPAPLASMEPGEDGRPPRLQVRLFGLLGPNGALPVHITEYARERQRHAGDPTLSRFLDLFHHRFLALFYRAWAQAQPHVNRDRPLDDRFAAYVGAFIGVSAPEWRNRDQLADEAKLFHTGALIRQVRNAEGLASILRQFFGVPVEIEEFVGHWLALEERERTRLGDEGATLGAGAVLGGRVWDRQSKFRIRLGPLTRAQYEAFLPGGSRGAGAPGAPSTAGPGDEALLEKLVDWVRLYLCYELEWDVRLVLARGDVPPLALDGRGRLGWTTWLGTRQAASDADDLCLDAEHFVEGLGVAAA